MPTLVPTKYEIIEIDVEDVYKAIKKNGFDHLRGQWFAGTGACVMGQAALNLGIEPEVGFLDEFLTGLGFDPEFDPEDEEKNKVVNDFEAYNLISQLNQLPVDYESKWYTSTENGIGSIIIHWNDKRASDGNGRYLTNEDGEYLYDLPTYEAVAEMAYDLLSPHFGKKIKLIVHDYAAQDYRSE